MLQVRALQSKAEVAPTSERERAGEERNGNLAMTMTLAFLPGEMESCWMI